MKKCVFINPYFGKFPANFELFLKTCENNPQYNWIFFTDDDESYNYPPNVSKVLMSFDELKKLFQSKFDFEIILDKPYKLCDYKPSYGYVFEEYIKEYSYWGHCDIDTVMGDLDSFLPRLFSEDYDKIFTLGHMEIYKNTPENNRAFMLPYMGRKIYRESFATSSITKFDETFGGDDNVNSIFVENGKKVFAEDWSENFTLLPTKFIRTKYNPYKSDYDIFPYKEIVYLWNRGRIFMYYLENGKLKKEPVMYIHFQERLLHIKSGVLESDSFYIVPNYCIKADFDDITETIFGKINKNPISFHFLEFKWNRLKKKVRAKIGSAGKSK